MVSQAMDVAEETGIVHASSPFVKDCVCVILLYY